MSYEPSWVNGDWIGICDVCGAKVKASMLMDRWDGFKVDERCWEPRHPQDFVRGIPDISAPPWTRPEQQDQFVTLALTPGIAGLAEAGTCIAGSKYPNPGTIPPSTFGGTGD